MRDHYTFWLCDCCTLAAVNGETCDDHGDGEPLDAFEAPGDSDGWLTPGWDSDDDGPTDGYLEFTNTGCDGCHENASKGGSLYRFHVFIRYA
jgi:hypothetical protein